MAPQAFEEVVEQAGELEIEAAPHLGQDADADVEPPIGHRKGPAVAGEERAVEAEDRFANVLGRNRGVGAPGDRDVALVIDEQAGCTGHDGVHPIGSDHQVGVPSPNGPATLRFDLGAVGTDADLGGGRLVLDGRAGRLGGLEKHGVEHVAWERCTRAAGARRDARRRESTRGIGAPTRPTWRRR